MNSTNPQPKKSRKGIYAIIIVEIALIAGIWIWKEIELRSFKKESAKHATEMEYQFTQQILEMQTHNLKSMIKPLVWAVRSEMLKNDVTDINFYINELVKEKGFQFILITDDKNNIIASTNKKWEGNPFNVTGLSSNVLGDSTIVNMTNNNIFLASAPVMGFNRRLGAVVISYSGTPSSFK
ncbi:MAG: hypothetical protein ABI315_11925 [Bacteroidia bacterium]